MPQDKANVSVNPANQTSASYTPVTTALLGMEKIFGS